jgi:hypothetical protein
MLTTAQLQALKAAILADANLNTLVAQMATGAITEYLRGDSTFIVWRSTTLSQDIYDAVTWANLTPTDAPDTTQAWMNRALACQGKQISLQILIQGKDRINSDKASIRAGLQDALTNLPSGSGGANVSGGWANVKPAMTRLANKYEKVWVTGTGTVATPGSLVIEGIPDEYSIVQALTQV